MTERPWIVCDRGHEVRVMPQHDGKVSLTVRVGGVVSTITLLGPQAQLAVAAALEGREAQ